MSLLDYMDIDVSSYLSGFVQARRNFDEVVKQLEYYAEFNINIQHIARISQASRARRHNRRRMNPDIIKPWLNEELCYATKQIVDTRYKSEYLHVWPSKPPTFAMNLEGIQHINRNNAVIIFEDGSSWKLKKYKPERYKPRNLASMCKELKNLNSLE
jgi:hypothetical protein